MQIFEIKIPPIVEDELAAFANYIAIDNQAAAAKWYHTIVEKIYSLETNPLRCPLAIESNLYNFEVRNLIVRNYRIIFRVQKNKVEILHIRHAKQNPQQL